MLVVCKGHNTCLKRDICSHSKIHEYDDIKCHVSEIDPPRCVCSHIYLRAEKLEKINENNN